MIALLLTLAVASPAERLYVFQFASEDVDAKVVGVIERAVVEEADAAGFDAVSHDEIAMMLDVEAAKQLAGCSAADSCVAELAGSLGVSRVVGGKLTALGASTILALTLTDAKSARVVARETIEGSVDELRKNTPAAVRRLLGVATETAAPSSSFPTLLVTGGAVVGVGVVGVVVGGIPYVSAQLALQDALAKDGADDNRENAAAIGAAHDRYEEGRAQWNSWGIVVAGVGAAALVGGAVVAVIGAVE